MSTVTPDAAAQVRQILATVLQQPARIDADWRRDQVEAWDSLKHLHIVFALEDAFGLSIPEEDMAGLGSLEAIVEYVGAHRGS